MRRSAMSTKTWLYLSRGDFIPENIYLKAVFCCCPALTPLPLSVHISRETQHHVYDSKT